MNPLTRSEMEEIIRQYPVGRTFEYCGRMLTVIQEAVPDPQSFWSRIVCHYADEFGQIRRIEFEVEHYPLLKRLTK